MSADFQPPRLYAIADFSSFAAAPDPRTAILNFIEELFAAGVRCLQLRDKQSSSREVLSLAREIKRKNSGRARLIMNDRADLSLAAGFDGVHLGQDDLSPAAARRILGDQKIIGLSTHNFDQLRAAASEPVDYFAFGPIFATQSKTNPEPTVGLPQLVQACKLAAKPIVAIGGITSAHCASVIKAGAASVAVISGLLPHPQKRIEEFFRNLG